MTLTPLLAAPTLVQVHALAAVAALALGPLQFALPKGTGSHRPLGYAWVALMALIATSAFGITGVAGEGRYSYIHLIAAATLACLPLAVWRARRHRIDAHKWSMIALYAGALVITGAFTLLPGRLMHAVVFGP